MTDALQTTFGKSVHNGRLVVERLGHDHPFHAGPAHDVQDKGDYLPGHMDPAGVNGEFEMVVAFLVGGDADGRGEDLAVRVLRNPEPGAALDQLLGRFFEPLGRYLLNQEIFGNPFIYEPMVRRQRVLMKLVKPLLVFGQSEAGRRWQTLRRAAPGNRAALGNG